MMSLDGTAILTSCWQSIRADMKSKGLPSQLPNHEPIWGLKSQVHTQTGGRVRPDEMVVPIRISRTASDGNPLRSFSDPFPAMDTATVWGFAQGNVTAERVIKDRAVEKFIRNPTAEVTLWRIQAKRMRTFTAREYARLQTFPDDWIFVGSNKREFQLQIGNAVPVEFAKRIAISVRQALEMQDQPRIRRPRVQSAKLVN
ncbi:MAG: hypothetical protein HC858_02945 [Brachymonas sp.]|nr:hypothetical protein [Brachymonas sp.]